MFTPESHATSSKRAKRRIILLLDGTWNEDYIFGNDSNIVRIRDIIADSLDPTSVLDSKNSPDLRIGASPRTFAGREYIVFYQRGVGTGPLDKIRGGAFGEGLDINVRRAYRFLSFHYEIGDEVFIFGFSRGSYTARSLTGYLGSVGLLRCEACTEAQESLAWAFYRTPTNDRHPGTWKQLEPYVHSRDLVRIACLALFDTVGALGVPFHYFRKVNRSKFEFHDVELSSLVGLALHALAIDEHRRPFEATMWRRNKFKRTSAAVEQVWFPGAHSNIGGGGISDEERDNGPRGLDDLALDWMIRRVLAYFPDFPFTKDAWSCLPDQATLGPQHARTFWYKFFPRAIRSIGNRPQESSLLNGTDNIVGYNPKEKGMNESIHIWAIQRLGKKIIIDKKSTIYCPPNLILCIPELISTYSKTKIFEPSPDILTITAMDGTIVIPQSEMGRCVLIELLSAWKRLQEIIPGLANILARRLPE